MFALLIMLACVHPTLATHFCGGRVAAVKMSLTGKLASCGMESDMQKDHSGKTGINDRCCSNKLSVYSIDNNYTPSEYRAGISLQTRTPIQMFLSAVLFQFAPIFPPHLAYNGPPGIYIANAVNRADICIYRI